MTFTQQLDAYEQLDLMFERLECALSLRQIEYPEAHLAHLNVSLANVFEQLLEVTDEFMGMLSLSSSEALPLWGQVMLADTAQDTISMARSNSVLDQDVNSQSLRQCIGLDRIEENGFPSTFNSRLKQQGWEPFFIGEELNTQENYSRARSYFNQILEEHSLDKKIPLSTFRDYERTHWKEFSLPFDQAMEVIEQVFSLLDPCYGRRISRAFEEGRIRVSQPGTQSLCMDTPSGSYIQIAYDGTVESLALLGHECGHLVHQETVRDKYVLKQEIQPYLAEAIAITFENKVVEHYFYQNGSTHLVPRWRYRQYIEWTCRHLLLTQFELALYELQPINKSSIQALWLTVNRTFYPEQIYFEEVFSDSWQAVTHIILAPFYLLVYPKAYALADMFHSDDALLKFYMACTSWSDQMRK